MQELKHTNVIYVNPRDCHSITCDQYAAQYGFPGEDTAQRWDFLPSISNTVFFLTFRAFPFTLNIGLTLSLGPLRWKRHRLLFKRRRPNLVQSGTSAGEVSEENTSYIMQIFYNFHHKVYLSRLQQSGKREEAHKVSHATGKIQSCETR